MLARGDEFADALAGAPIAAAHGAPILLTTRDTVPQITLDALDELAPEEVILLGGTAEIGPEIEDGLGERFDVTRLGGVDRTATAARVAEAVADEASGVGEVDGLRSVFLASAGAFPDALAAGSTAAAPDAPIPILLTHRDALASAAEQALPDLAIEQVIIVGGTASVGVRRDADRRLRARRRSARGRDTVGDCGSAG